MACHLRLCSFHLNLLNVIWLQARSSGFSLAGDRGAVSVGSREQGRPSYRIPHRRSQCRQTPRPVARWANTRAQTSPGRRVAPGEEGGERREVPGQRCRGRRGGRQSFRTPSPARAPSVQPRPSRPVEPPSRAGALRAALVQPRRAAGLGLMQPPRPGKGDGEMALREHCTSATAWYAGGPPGLHCSPLPPAWQMGLGPAERPVPRAGADS